MPVDGVATGCIVGVISLTQLQCLCGGLKYRQGGITDPDLSANVVIKQQVSVADPWRSQIWQDGCNIF